MAVELRVVRIDHNHAPCAVPDCTTCAIHNALAMHAAERRIIFHQLLPSAHGDYNGPCVHAQDLQLLRRIMRAVWGRAAACGC